jgi:membrane-associated protein
MELMMHFVDMFLHLDKYLNQIIDMFGIWTYLVLFLIIFCETGLVVTPFLPGDSLIFMVGALAATGAFNIVGVGVLLVVAAILGDSVNYEIGRLIGPKVFAKDMRFLKREYLLKTQAFYEKHGGLTIIIARFMPIIRTFAPFVAGVATMRYSKFISYNIVGGTFWVLLFLLTGYYFGNIPFVRHNFSLVAIAIVFISILPGIIGFINMKMKQAQRQVE